MHARFGAVPGKVINMILCMSICSCTTVGTMFTTNYIYDVSDSDIKVLSRSDRAEVHSDVKDDKAKSSDIPGVTDKSSSLANAEVEGILANSGFANKAHILALWWDNLVGKGIAYTQMIGMLANVYGEGSAGLAQYDITLPNWNGPGQSAVSSARNPLFIITAENITAVLAIGQSGNHNKIGFGSCQWTTASYVVYVAEEYQKAIDAGLDLNDPDNRVKAEFTVFDRWMADEVRNTTGWSTATDPYTAAYRFCYDLERPGSKAAKAEERGQWAIQLYDLLKDVKR